MEKYYYGQGKIFLANRDTKGNPINQRWVGDVGELNFELSTEELTHKESWSGQRATAKRLNIGKDGKLSMTWYNHSPENLAFLLYGEVIKQDAGKVTETITTSVKVGDRITLKNINISNVKIGKLVLGTDYTTDEKYGAITFLTAQEAPISVEYDYAASKSTPMFTANPQDVFFRYEGINLAENGEPIVVEFYKTQFSPAQAINLINNDTSLNGMQTTAGVLYDSEREENKSLGRYGRILMGSSNE